MNYAIPLQLKRYGPDILSDVALTDLTASDVGIAPGDALWLKRGSTDWWNHMAKRQREQEKSTGKDKVTVSWSDPNPAKRHNPGQGSTNLDGLDLSNLAQSTESDPVKYEQRWNDGGCKRFYGPHMKRGDKGSMQDCVVWYFCEGRQDWFPVPPGYVAPYPSAEAEDDDPFR